MPRFYFHVRDGDGRIDDFEGMECPDIESAKKEADVAARELVAEALKFHEHLDGRTIEIVDENGAVVAEVLLRNVLET
ncbi:MAG TPA: hypothetical protein VH000_08475 [Rhizomicrobium sp.]|nr:hypothetical protein [Rhizomicrobium sp.]